jgi:hypothetical protein
VNRPVSKTLSLNSVAFYFSFWFRFAYRPRGAFGLEVKRKKLEINKNIFKPSGSVLLLAFVVARQGRIIKGF